MSDRDGIDRGGDRDSLDGDDAEMLCSYPGCRRVCRALLCVRHRAALARL